MQVLLRCSARNKPEKKIKVSRDVLIGRERGGCDLRVASNEVSRRHCQILLGDREVAVRDLGSANGTRVNGERVPPKIRFPIDPGDVISVGPLTITVEYRGGKTKKRSRADVEPEDEFLSQDDALAALDAPSLDTEQSAPEILIQSRLIDSGDDYGSGLETVEKSGEGADGDFDYTPSADTPAEQFVPIEEEPAELEPLELDSDEPEPLELVEPMEPELLEPVETAESVPAAGEVIPASDPAPAPAADRAPEESPKKRGLKSLFRRKKKDSETEPQDAAARAIEPVSALPAADSGDVIPIAPPEQEDAWEPEDGAWEAEDELVPVEEVESVELPAAPTGNFGSEDVEELELVEELEDDEDPDEPVDPGFSDFLNQL